MLSELKPKFNPIINIIVTPFKAVHPNILTATGLIPPVIFIILMINGQYIWALVSFLGLFLDMFDGAVARMTNRTSEFGGLLDSTLDRVTDAMYIFGFALVGLVSYQLATLLIVLSYLISYIRSRAELAGKARFVLNVGIIERPERLLFLFVALLGQVIWPQFIFLGLNCATLTFIFLAIFSFVTIMQRFIKASKLLD